jgi:phosphate ABC transporter phosphate-binding protein
MKRPSPVNKPEGPVSMRTLQQRQRWRRSICAAAAVSLAVVGTGTVAVSARAGNLVPVSGAGSTWSSIAMDQWVGSVGQYGIKVNFAATGSSDGRTQFKNATVDFAVSEIPYGVTDNGTYEPPPARGYAYMPIVAGGTSFMYQLHINGQQVTNLRLSGLTIANIFTGNITKWNDPAIAADNPGIVLPPEPVIPVVRSDGSGTTAQLTTWLSKNYAAIWNAYCAKAGRVLPCGITSTYPVVSGYGFITQQQSTNLAGYITQTQSEGTIGYVEAAYANQQNYPVAKMLNAAGYYTAPTASNVAVALTAAQINTDPTSPNYLTQVLDGVYANPDPRAYPLSSYSYMIIPTKVEAPLTLDKGYTLGKFAYYFLCEGQQSVGELGYSPLPLNLVQAAVDQVKKIPGVDVENLDLSKCNNPTFDPSGKNLLAETAQQPQACDKLNVTMCPDPTGGATTPTYVAAAAGGSTPTTPPAAAGKTQKPTTGKRTRPTTGKTTRPPTGPSGGGAKPVVTGTGPAPVSTPGSGPEVTTSPGSAAGGAKSATSTSAGPLQGQSPPVGGSQPTVPPADPLEAGSGPAGPAAASGAAGVTNQQSIGTSPVGAVGAAPAVIRAVPISLAVSSGWSFQDTLMVLAVVLLALVVVGPPLLSRRLGRRS